MSVPNAANKRIDSLDQFRGYTVAGMFLVNFLSPFVAAPFILKHHSSYCSYADTIMGNFLFAVGFAFRLSFGRRAIQQGLAQAYWHAAVQAIQCSLTHFHTCPRSFLEILGRAARSRRHLLPARTRLRS
jgi:predicted acyltransferase